MRKVVLIVITLLTISCAMNNSRVPKETRSIPEESTITKSLPEVQPLEIYSLESFGGVPDCHGPIDVEGMGWHVIARLLEDERTVSGHGTQWQNNTMYLYVEHDGNVVVPLKQIRIESFSQYYEKDPDRQKYIQYYIFPSFMIGEMCSEYVEINVLCAEMDTDLGFEATIHIKPDGKLSYFIDPHQFNDEEIDIESYQL